MEAAEAVNGPRLCSQFDAGRRFEVDCPLSTLCQSRTFSLHTHSGRVLRTLLERAAKFILLKLNSRIKKINNSSSSNRRNSSNNNNNSCCCCCNKTTAYSNFRV